MADEKTIYKMKTPSGDPVRVEEAWKDANGELLTEKVNKADAQTITGLKTFSTLPQSSATPSDDKDLATKKYSDDLWATRKAQEEKCYQALKTVTKDFTRTDPVYVRIGEDGEPEIHYTMTQSAGGSYFANMDLGDATLYVHNGQICTSMVDMCIGITVNAVIIDSIRNVTKTGGIFSNWNANAKITRFEIVDPAVSSSVTSSDYWNFWNYHGYELEDGFTFPYLDLSEVQSINLGMTFVYSWFTHFPAWDLSKATKLSFEGCYRMQTMKGYGMKVSFDCVQSPLKHDAILEIFNNLGTVDATAGITLTLGSGKLALMSDEEKKIATDKGWTLA